MGGRCSGSLHFLCLVVGAPSIVTPLHRCVPSCTSLRPTWCTHACTVMSRHPSWREHTYTRSRSGGWGWGDSRTPPDGGRIVQCTCSSWCERMHTCTCTCTRNMHKCTRTHAHAHARARAYRGHAMLCPCHAAAHPRVPRLLQVESVLALHPRRVELGSAALTPRSHRLPRAAPRAAPSCVAERTPRVRAAQRCATRVVQHEALQRRAHLQRRHQ